MLPSNIPLYGYKWADEEKSAYVPHEVTAPIVVRIFREAASAKTLIAICRDLNLEGVLTPRDQWRRDKGDPNDPPRGDPWRRQTVHNILMNPSYTGNHAAFRHDYTNKKRDVDHATGRVRTSIIHKIREDDSEEIILLPNAAPALVSEQVFNAVRERLATNKRESTRRNKQSGDALLRGGYMKCGRCGKTMHVHNKHSYKDTHHYYCPSSNQYDDPNPDHRCSTRKLNVEETDAQVWAMVYQIIKDPRRLVSEIMRRLDESTLTTDALEAYEHKLADIDRQLSNLARTIAQMDSPDDAAPFVARSKELGLERRGIVDARGQAEMARAQRQRLRDRLFEFERWCQAFADHPELWTLERKRLALYAMEVTVYANSRDETDPFTVKAGPENDAGERITLSIQTLPMTVAPDPACADSLSTNF